MHANKELHALKHINININDFFVFFSPIPWKFAENNDIMASENKKYTNF